jgi:cellulose synthase/poly-beta-1,6-N-acetylglucosamine synthase-like glycosyltransferase
MEIIPIIYLAYMFFAMYFLFLFLLLYFNNKGDIFYSPKSKKKYSLSIIVPCWNEEKTIGKTIDHLLEIDYKELKKIIIVDDCSSDNSFKIAKEYEKKYPKKIKVVQTPKQTGNAAGAKIYGSEFVDTELIGFVDADSYPEKDSINKLVGFFDKEKTGGVTCTIIPRNKNKLLEKMQVIEYNTIAFTRKLLGYIDAIYVTPGPLAIYRKSAFDEIKGFDKNNLTEDIEIAWKLIHKGYKIEMCLSTSTTTTAPNKFKEWYIQRRRWGIGGIQCISKYKKEFMKKGILGMFVIPFFILQFFLGVVGLGIFLYLITTRTLSNFLFTKYSLTVGTPLITMNDFYITPSFLNYLGIILFVVGGIFTLVVLSIMKKTVLKKQNIFNLLFYTGIYLSIYPFIAISSVYNYFKRNNKWR